MSTETRNSTVWEFGRAVQGVVRWGDGDAIVGEDYFELTTQNPSRWYKHVRESSSR
jgi:hypothetical protein